MSSPFDAARKFWLSLTGAGEPSTKDLPPVIVHDPAADRPHDLDDPFFGSDVQSRMGDVIAQSKAPSASQDEP